MTVRIEIHGDTAGEALRELKGLSDGLLVRAPVAPPTPADESGQSAGFGVGTKTAVTTFAPLTVLGEPSTFTGDVEVQSGGSTPKRERGKPAPGRARRTKEEIAEDEAADALSARADDMLRPGETGQISANPENRVGPEDDPATEAQDKADEQAEVEATRKPEKPLTREDVKNAMTEYVKTFGLPATQEDGPKLIGNALGEPPEGEAAWRLSLVPEDDQKALAAVVGAFSGAITANPFGRKKVA